MTKTFIAGLLSLSLAVSGVAATPAQAGENDQIAKLLFGIAAVALIARAVDNRNDRAPARTRALTAEQRRLPGSCLYVVETRQGPQRLLSGNCLSQTYAFADRLPDTCTVTYRTRRHDRTGFSPRCLNQAGFTIDFRD